MPKSSPPAENFPARLREAREARQLSQGDLAKRASLQVSAISHFETGGRKPSFDNLRKLAEALTVSTDYLLGRVSDMNAVSSSADKLHRQYAGLPSELQEMADGFMEMLAKKAKAKRQGGNEEDR